MTTPVPTTGPTASPATDPAADPALEISIRTAVGEGRTLLSAFDRALLEVGVGDFNLITLSSVIPPGSRLVQGERDRVPGGHGDRLYCVKSTAYADHPGEVVSAGLGWVVHPEIGGLFVEHAGGTRESVEEQIHVSLADMAAARGIDFGEMHTAVASAHCTQAPVCALAIATYAVADWTRP